MWDRMAGIKLQAPGQFDFSKPAEWPKWRKRFQQYKSASGLDAEGEPQQVNTLLYCIGEEAESVLISTNVTANQRSKYSDVMEKFDSYFDIRRNTMFERARFNAKHKRKLNL